jgi:hypothetical protein
MAGMYGAPLQGNFPYALGNSLNESKLIQHVTFCYAVVLLTRMAVTMWWSSCRLTFDISFIFCHEKQWKQPTRRTRRS